MIRKLLIISVVCVLSACGGHEAARTADAIAEAEAALNAGRYDSARSLADEMSGDSTLQLGVEDLCRLSIVYMTLSDNVETDINTALATRCYRRAMTADADSAAAYYGALPIEESRHVDLMSKLEPMLSGDRNMMYIDEDSIETDDAYEEQQL